MGDATAATRFEVIASAYPLHAQRIAENCFAFHPEFFENFMTDSPEPEHRAPSDVLRGAFVWEFTSEGHTYWSRLARRA